MRRHPEIIGLPAICALALAASCNAAEIPLPFHFDQLLALAEQVQSGRVPDPRKDIETLIARATAAADPLSAAYAKAGVAALEERDGRWRFAERTVREAAVAVRAAEPEFLGRIALWLAQESFRGSRFDRAGSWARVAITEFSAAGDRRNLARSQFAASQVVAGREKRSLLHEAALNATTAGDRRVLASIQIELGEQQRQAGEFAAAVQTLRASSLTLDQLEEWRLAGRAYTFLARAEIAHSHHREALQHLQRAEAVLEKSGDSDGIIATRLERGKIHAAAGERKEALATLDQVRKAITAMPAGSPRRARFAGLAYSYQLIKDYKQSVEVGEAILKESDRRVPFATYWILSCGYFHLGRLEDAVDIATTGISRSGAVERLSNVATYRWRARALDKLGRHQEAARDIFELNRIGDPMMDRLMPDDEWKRAFLETAQQIADDGIAVLWRAGKRIDALQMAEKFRARAFLDLLASRGAQDLDYPASAVAGNDPRLSSSVLSTPPTVAQLTSLAKESKGPILCYWQHPDGIYVWLLSVNGEVKSAFSPAPEAKVQQLVERARRFQYKPDLEAWRELYRLVFQPVQPWLASSKGQVLTILPHRSLLQLPFGALLAPNQRYLLEDFPLRVTPAAGFLLRPTIERDGAYVLMGAPVRMAASLPSLPGAQRELARAASLLPNTQVLSGPAMQEPRIREEASRARVLHFATHAVVDPGDPFQSFLALSERGRLTVGHIYDLRIRADLVMMSACRSGSGRVSADGLLGFTRAFLYAGAASVIAPLWDIPDEPTVRLVEEFYRHYSKGAAKSLALRSAQLKLLADLRAGRVAVSTPAGQMTLPEHPGIWAAFVLQGAD